MTGVASPQVITSLAGGLAADSPPHLASAQHPLPAAPPPAATAAASQRSRGAAPVKTVVFSSAPDAFVSGDSAIGAVHADIHKLLGAEAAARADAIVRAAEAAFASSATAERDAATRKARKIRQSELALGVTKRTIGLPGGTIAAADVSGEALPGAPVADAAATEGSDAEQPDADDSELSTCHHDGLPYHGPWQLHHWQLWDCDCGWGHLYEYCSPFGDSEGTDLQHSASGGSAAATQCCPEAADDGGCLPLDEDGYLDERTHRRTLAELAAAAAEELAEIEQARADAAAADAAFPPQGDLPGRGYLPKHRERFFLADGASCGGGDTLVVSAEGLDRLLLEIQNVTVARSLRLCVVTALQAPSDALNIAVQSCLLQHNVVGDLKAGKQCSVHVAVDGQQHMECAAIGGAWACSQIPSATAPRIRCKWGEVGAPGSAVAYIAAVASPGQEEQWEAQVSKVHQGVQFLQLDRLCEAQPLAVFNHEDRPPPPLCTGSGAEASSQECTAGQPRRSSPQQPPPDDSREQQQSPEQLQRPGTRTSGLSGWGGGLFPDPAGGGNCHECADRQLASDLAAARQQQATIQGEPLDLDMFWALLAMACAAAAAAAGFLLRQRYSAARQQHETTAARSVSQLRQAAASALRDATVSGNPQKLAAAIATAEQLDVAEPLLAKARLQLRQKQRKRSGSGKDKAVATAAPAAAKRPGSSRAPMVALPPSAATLPAARRQPSSHARSQQGAAGGKGPEPTSPVSSDSPLSPLQPRLSDLSSAAASIDLDLDAPSPALTRSSSNVSNQGRFAAGAPTLLQSLPPADTPTLSTRAARASAAAGVFTRGRSSSMNGSPAPTSRHAPATAKQQQRQQLAAKAAAAHHAPPVRPATPPVTESLGPWGERRDMTASVAAEQAALRTASVGGGQLRPEARPASPGISAWQRPLPEVSRSAAAARAPLSQPLGGATSAPSALPQAARLCSDDMVLDVPLSRRARGRSPWNAPSPYPAANPDGGRHSSAGWFGGQSAGMQLWASAPLQQQPLSSRLSPNAKEFAPTKTWRSMGSEGGGISEYASSADGDVYGLPADSELPMFDGRSSAAAYRSASPALYALPPLTPDMDPLNSHYPPAEAADLPSDLSLESMLDATGFELQQDANSGGSSHSPFTGMADAGEWSAFGDALRRQSPEPQQRQLSEAELTALQRQEAAAAAVNDQIVAPPPAAKAPSQPLGFGLSLGAFGLGGGLWGTSHEAVTDGDDKWGSALAAVRSGDVDPGADRAAIAKLWS